MTTLLLALLIAAPAQLAQSKIELPGGPGPIAMDYLAADADGARIWVPAGNGTVDVIDAATGAVTSIDGFESARRGERTLGPSSASVGEGFVYVGNRANSAICAIDAKTLERKGCLVLPTAPDGVAFVAPTHELWVTTPRDQSLTLVDLKKPATPMLSTKIPLPGDPEGYAVDTAKGVFYTNLEDKDRTLAIDVKTRKIVSTWKPECGADGPRGLAVDSARGQIFVACAAGSVKALSTKDGSLLGEVEAGAGIDNFDYDPKTHTLYIASGKAASFTLATVNGQGQIAKVAQAPTAKGARVVVVGAKGAAFIADSAGGRILVLHPAQ
jgi:DNA-binding beta-propeller fold protein YncE